MKAPHIPTVKEIQLPKTATKFNDFIAKNRKVTKKPELAKDVQKTYDLWFQNF